MTPLDSLIVKLSIRETASDLRYVLPASHLRPIFRLLTDGGACYFIMPGKLSDFVSLRVRSRRELPHAIIIGGDMHVPEGPLAFHRNSLIRLLRHSRAIYLTVGLSADAFQETANVSTRTGGTVSLVVTARPRAGVLLDFIMKNRPNVPVWRMAVRSPGGLQ